MKQFNFITTITGTVSVEDYMQPSIEIVPAKAEAKERIGKWISRSGEIDVTGPEGSYECAVFNLEISGDVEVD